MSVYTQMQATNLKEMLKVLCQQVLGNVRNAIAAVESMDEGLAQSVIKRHQQMLRMELDILQTCKALLANEAAQPADLQYAITMLRVNADLERMAKQTVAIARYVVQLGGSTLNAPRPEHLLLQAATVITLVQKTMDSLLALNAQDANDAIALDDTVGDCYGRLYGVMHDAEADETKQSQVLAVYLQIAKELERLADHAVSICRDVLDRSVS